MVELANKRDSCKYLLLLGSFQGFLGKEKQIMYGVWYGSILPVNR